LCRFVEQVVYKLDGDGECIHIVRDDFRTCREFSFVGWGETEFRRMAVSAIQAGSVDHTGRKTNRALCLNLWKILAGCDYLDSIPGIGIKTAHKLLRKHKTIEKVVQNVRLDGNLTVPSDYIPQFRLAELVFLHQRVYDPRTGRLDTLLPVVREGGLEAVEEGYIGPDMDPEMAKGIAEGRVHPETKEELEDLWPDYHPGTGRANQTQLSTSGSKSGKVSTCVVWIEVFAQLIWSASVLPARTMLWGFRSG
jgi:exonuclease-1